MSEVTSVLTFKAHREPGNPRAKIIVELPQDLVRLFYQHALATHQAHFDPSGFRQHQTPLAYIDTQYRANILKHLSEFLLHYCVISFLHQSIRSERLVVIGEPKLHAASIDPEGNSFYEFEVTVAPSLLIHDWKYLPFRAPKRRLYKDIDKQASNFIEEESAGRTIYGESHQEVTIGDWVLFSAQLLNEKNELIAPSLKERLWLPIGEEETSLPYQELFAGRHLGEQFVSNAQVIQEYFSSTIDTNYRFLVTIEQILPKAYVDLEYIKEHFKLKTDKKLHQKLVEVYSSKNDLSLRRSMVEEAMRVLHLAYPVEVPHHAVDMQERLIIRNIQNNPDYTVYKQQRDFLQTVRLLAEKQIREVIVIDHFAYQESLPINDFDVCLYLNLTKRARTRDFINFLHPRIRVNTEESPICHEELKQTCLREKTLNHILHHLNK